MEALCPQCDQALTRSPGAIDFVCPRCSSAYSVCPECGAVNQPGRRYCSQCSVSTVRICAACRQENWAGDEQCVRCGKPLDLLESLTKPSSRDARARFLIQQEQALSIKRREAAQAESRMEHFRRLEQQRQQELERTEQLEKKRERQTIMMIFFLTALLILSIIILALFWIIQAA